MSTEITIDFETRSKCDLKTHGAWKYSQDPTTEVLCMAFKEGINASQLWVNPSFFFTLPQEQRQHLHIWTESTVPKPWAVCDVIIEAHNASFERAIWQNIMVPKFGWPEISLRHWRCSAAKCSAAALPRSLGEASKALRLPVQKDNKGRTLMLKMCKPRKPRKAEKVAFLNSDYFIGPKVEPKTITKYGLEQAEHLMPTLWHEEPQQFLDLFNYCIQDVEAEHALSQAVRDLDPIEQEAWFLDQEINERGFLIDVETVHKVEEILQDRKASLLDEVDRLTDGRVQSPQQTAESLKWLAEQGLELPNMQAETVKQALADLKRV